MRVFTFLAVVLLLTGAATAQTSIDVDTQFDFKLALDFAHATASVDTIFLTESGGVYTTEDTVYMQIKKPLVIMARPGLEEKPIFTHSDPDSDVIELFRVHDDIEFNGIIFDGGHPQTHGIKHGIRLGHGPENQVPRAFAKEGLDIIIRNCDFRNFYDNGDRENEAEGHAVYFLRPDQGDPTLRAGNVIIENCTFRDIGDEAIRMSETEKYDVQRVVDTLIVRNCSFRNISSECVRFYADTDEETEDAYVLIEHLTVDSCATRMAFIKNNAGTIFRDIIVTNSRLPKLSRSERSDYVCQIQQEGSLISHIDTLNMIFAVPEPSSGRVSATKGGEVDSSTVYAFDPLYADPVAFDYTLAPNSPAYGKQSRTPTSIGNALGDLRWADPAVSVGDQVQNLPASVDLMQNYPNPFNPLTTIAYTVDQPGNVTITVFDITGKAVSTLVSGKKAAGSYSVQWNAAGQASGVYFYRLTLDDRSIVKKMMLIR